MENPMRNNKIRLFLLFSFVVAVAFCIPVDSAWGQPESISLNYSFSIPSVEYAGSWPKIQLPGCETLNLPGLPPVPVKLGKILLPENRKVSKIIVETEEYLTFPQSYTLPALPSPRKLKEPGEQELSQFTGIYPQQAYEVCGIHRLHGYQILLVRLFPVRYDGKAKRISFTSRISLQINLESTKSVTPDVQIPRESTKDENLVRSWVDNPSLVTTYLTKTTRNGTGYDYLIITTFSFVSAFQPLVTYYQNKGIRTIVVTTQEITAEPSSPYYQTGRDNAERIRNFIIYAYRNWGISYVLLGGDTEVIPARYFKNPVEEDPIPADMYYSNLDGDFDYNRNNIFGEPYIDGPEGGDVDLLAEVFVGRVPASTVSEVTSWVNKNLSYLQTETVALKKAGMIGQQLDDFNWGGDGKDDIVNRCFPSDWEISRFYERDRTYSVQNVINYLNSGPHLVNNFAHGSCDYAFGLDGSDVRALTNTTYFILYSQGCYEASFDNPYGYDSITEYFITSPAAAVATIGNSRYGWYSPWAIRNGPSQVFDREFFNVLFNQNFTGLGQAFYRSKQNLTAALGGYQRYVYYELNLFGDPALPVVQPAQGPAEELQGLVYFVKDNNLWVNDLKKEETRQLTYLQVSPGPGKVANLVLNDDGSKLIFAYKQDTLTETHLYQVNSDGSGLENLTVKYNLSLQTKNQSSGAYSPNGDLFAFVAQPRSGNIPERFQLYLKELTGTRRLFQLTFLDGNVSSPLFIDSSRILFRFQSSRDNCEDFYTITTTGASLTNLTSNASTSPYFPKLGQPALNRDKTQIIYGKKLQNLGQYSSWRLYTRSVLPGGVESEIISNLYYYEDPIYQPDPKPCFVGDNAIAFAGERPYNKDTEIFVTTYNASDPYLHSVVSSGPGGDNPVYFLPLPKSTQVAYVSAGQIHVRRSDGTDLQITSTINENRDPAFSFTGEYLTYAGNGIWVCKADGTEAVQVEEFFSARYPAFSPDGKWVVYVRNNDIYARRIDRSVLALRLTSTSNIIKSDLSFTPDGTRIIYTGATSSGTQIFALPVTIFDTIIKVEGSPVNLTSSPGCDNFHACVSPDGKNIIFISRRLGSNRIFIMNADGTNQRLLTFNPEPVNPAYPQFSPYGEQQIMFFSGVTLYQADLDEGRSWAVSPSVTSDYRFAWGIYLPAKITVQRQFPFSRIDPRLPLRYQLHINFNQLSPPAGLIITEILPTLSDGTASDTWVLTEAAFNDTPLVPPTSNGRTTGTLKWILSNNFPLGQPVTGILKLTVKPGNDGPANALRALNGGVSDGASYNATYGDSYLTIADINNPGSCPTLPVDSNEDFLISDEELLFTIDLWAKSMSIRGWPVDVSSLNWDYWLLQIIDFWVNPSGYTYDAGRSLSDGEPRWKKAP